MILATPLDLVNGLNRVLIREAQILSLSSPHDVMTPLGPNHGPRQPALAPTLQAS
jgi:hypothetical protein